VINVTSMVPLKYCQLGPKSHQNSVLARNLFKGVHDAIHSVKKPVKPCLLKYFKWLLSYQRQRAGKGLILFSNQYTNDTLQEAQKHSVLAR